MTQGRVSEDCPASPDAGDPDRSPTLVDFDEWSSLCSTGHTPNIVTGALLRFLQEHFSDPNKIENKTLRDNIFKDQLPDTTEGLVDKGILIDPIYKWNPQDFTSRPAIYIKRNGMRVERYGINDGLTVGLGKDREGNVKTYEGEYHVVGVLGSHTVFCIGRSGAETEVVGSEVFREIQHFVPVLRRDLKLKKLAVTEMTEIQQLEEYDQHFVVAIIAAWAYFEKWRLVPEAPWLKGFTIAPLPDGETALGWTGKELTNA